MIENINLNELGKAITFLKSLSVKANPVDMDQANIPIKHSCGTPACFGGYLAMFYSPLSIKEASEDSEDMDYVDIEYMDYKDLNFRDGAFSFSVALGFKSDSHLMRFLSKNPSLWGNIFGGNIFGGDSFSNNSAFTGVSGNTKISLNEIIERLEIFCKNIQHEKNKQGGL